MLRLLSTFLLITIVSTSSADVMAYSVADDNFEMPDHLVRINLETGDYTSMGQIGDPYIALEGLALSPNGTLYGADDNTKTLVQIVPGEGSAFPVANVNQNLGFGSVPESYDFGLTFSCNQTLYMVVKDTQELYTVDENTGDATLVGNTGHDFTSLASWGDDLYAVASADFNLYKIDATTAESTLVGSLGDLGGDIELAGSGLSFDSIGNLWMAVNLRLSDPLDPFPSRIFKIDINSGQAELISETLVGIESLAIAEPGGCSLGNGPNNVEPVPTVGDLGKYTLMFLLFLFGLVSARNRKII